MTLDKTPSDALAPCPFCGAGETHIHVNKGTWNGQGYGEPVSVEVRHWCAAVPGQPSRMISRAGRDEASATAAWNTRWGSPVVAGEPVAPLTDEQSHGLLERMADEADKWAEGLSYEPTCKQVSGWCVAFLMRELPIHGIKGGQHGTE